MKINKMTRKEFEALPQKKWDETLEGVRSIIILPKRTKHDSGYRNMSFVACDKENQPICLFGGISDVLWARNAKYFSIDCLPKSGLLRVFANGHTFTIHSDLSTCEVECVREFPQ
jgi:hypothetical protein